MARHLCGEVVMPREEVPVMSQPKEFVGLPRAPQALFRLNPLLLDTVDLIGQVDLGRHPVHKRLPSTTSASRRLSFGS